MLAWVLNLGFAASTSGADIVSAAGFLLPEDRAHWIIPGDEAQAHWIVDEDPPAWIVE